MYDLLSIMNLEVAVSKSMSRHVDRQYQNIKKGNDACELKSAWYFFFLFFERHNGPASARPCQEGHFWKRSETEKRILRVAQNTTNSCAARITGNTCSIHDDKRKVQSCRRNLLRSDTEKDRIVCLFSFSWRLCVRPKMRVRRSLRRGAEPLKKDQIWKSVAH